MAFFVVMGVAGSGKTTVGQALAERLCCPFFDGDDFHPPQNIARMAGGIPLNDEDRAPWLARLRDLIHDHLARGETGILACSALKKRYRDQLRNGNPGVRFIHLHGDFDLIRARMQARQGHYMKTRMLQSQFEALEAPDPDEALTVSIEGDVEQVVSTILAQIEDWRQEDRQPPR